MALSISSAPTVVKAGYTSRWLSIHNPSRFTFTRSAGELTVQYAIFEEDGVTKVANSDSGAYQFPVGINDYAIDLAPFLRTLLNADDDSTAGQSATPTASYNSLNGGKPFRIGYRVYNTGSYTVDANVWYAIRAVQQLRATNGSNLAYFVPAVTLTSSGATNDALGYFLTEFTEPTLFWSSAQDTPASGDNVAVFWPTPAFTCGGR